MADGPATLLPDAPPLWQLWRDLSEQQARTSQSVALFGGRRLAFGVRRGGAHSSGR